MNTIRPKNVQSHLFEVCHLSPAVLTISYENSFRKPLFCTKDFSTLFNDIMCDKSKKKTWEYHKEAKFWLISTHLQRAPCCVIRICEGLYYFKQV